MTSSSETPYASEQSLLDPRCVDVQVMGLTSIVLHQRASADLPAIGYLVLLDYCFFLTFGLALIQVAMWACYGRG